jgi:hypothetical protein
MSKLEEGRVRMSKLEEGRVRRGEGGEGEDEQTRREWGINWRGGGWREKSVRISQNEQHRIA